MASYTRDQIREAYKKLPKEMQDAYFSADLDDKIFAIGKKHGLHIDKLGDLANEVGHVMLGFTPATEFTEHLKDRLGVGSDVARAIAQDINVEVFANIREAMQTASETLPEPPPIGSEKSEILSEIERDEMPSIMRGSHDPFEEKMKPEGHVMPKQPAKKEYNDIPDPYREPIDST